MAQGDRERWNERWAGALVGAPDPWVMQHVARVPSGARVLDVAGGVGRHAVACARLGHHVTLVDVSDAALAVATNTEPTLNTVCADLEVVGPPPGPWDVVVCVDYLQRDLPGRLLPMVAPGALYVVVHATHENLKRHAKPSARFLVETGEMRTLLGAWEILEYDEGWTPTGRHEVRCVARAR